MDSSKQIGLTFFLLMQLAWSGFSHSGLIATDVDPGTPVQATSAVASPSSYAGIALDAVGTLHIADQNNHRIRRVTPAGVISTVAGNGFTPPD